VRYHAQLPISFILTCSVAPIHPSIHSFRKYLLRDYHMPRTDRWWGYSKRNYRKHMPYCSSYSNCLWTIKCTHKSIVPYMNILN
jgi:hypothetical protein